MKSYLFAFYSKFFKKKKNDYKQWIIQEQKISIAENSFDQKNAPILLSVILADHINGDDVLLQNSINSVCQQINPRWELLILSNDLKIDAPITKNHNIELYPLAGNSGFYSSINELVSCVKGDFITFLRSGDELSNQMVESLTTLLSSKLIYTDEDRLSGGNQRCFPFFKPDWNPDYLESFNYFSHAVIYEKKLLTKLNGFKCDANDPFHELALRATTVLEEHQITHIDKVLFHFHGVKCPLNQTYRKRFIVSDLCPLVTIIIPTKDQLKILKSCLDGVFNHTAYKRIEIVIIDNDSGEGASAYLNKLKEESRIKLLHYNSPFNYSEMNNLAVKKANGSMICFLNNDISMMKDDWLSEMISQASRQEIGCVGAKLFYPDGTIQHAGVILGLKGYASHGHKGFSGDDAGYFNRLIVTHNVSAVTAACMVMRKEIFEEVGGFDAKNLKVAYNDVDLCLKVRKAGYRNLFTPHAQLIHHESKSRGKNRGKEQQKQLREESNYFRKKWGKELISDPAYNKNLTLLREDFSLGFDRVDE